MRTIDLRSDTCSQPDEAMKAAMLGAAVGNDSWGEDPSVNSLLKELCRITGKEDAILCCSGTMANLVAGMTYASTCGFGSEALMDSYTHTYWYEMGSLSTVAGLSIRTVPNTGEYLPVPEVKKALRPADVEMVRSRLLWTENTYMLGGGIPIAVQKMADLSAFARENDLKVHLDGARLFNAAIALDTEVSNITKHVDSVQICLSKCLCAPFGSVLLGSADFIATAKRCRQAVGGGLRQAGYMAAAGLYSPLSSRCLPGIFGYTVNHNTKAHISAKPLPLLKDLMEIIPEGGTVLDPFVGGGTTARAARETGRKCVAIERSKAYAGITAEACQKAGG